MKTAREVTVETAQQLEQERRELFLRILRRTGRVTFSAVEAGYEDVHQLYYLRRTNSDFAKRWEEAVNDAAEGWEDEAVRRAVIGVEEPVFWQGDEVARVTKYSDALLMFMLKGAKPAKYRENVKVDATVDGKSGIAVIPAILPVTVWEREAALQQQPTPAVEDQSKNTN